MGRDDFSVSPTYSGTQVSNKPLIVEDQPRRGCACFLAILILAAATVIFVLKVANTVDMSIELLAVDSPEVQEYAIKNLAGLGDPRAVDPLAAKLYDPNPDIRSSAAWALGEIRSVDGVDPLLAVVNTEVDYDLSYYAVSSLLMIASHCPDGFPRGEVCTDDTVAGRVTDYLIDRAEDDPLIAFIVSNSLFVDDVDVRILAAQLLVHIATEEERYMLEAALNDGDERVRNTVDLALAELDARTSGEPENMAPVEEIYPLVEGEFFPNEPSVGE